jgi:hypothetical protein
MKRLVECANTILFVTTVGIMMVIGFIYNS